MIDPIIHPRAEIVEISEDEYEKLNEPYEQQIKLYDCLTAWSNNAVKILKKHGYTDFHTYGGTYKFTCHPVKIESDNLEIQRADSALRAVKNLHEAILQDDKMHIANAGIELGLAVAKAHAEPYEKLAISGKMSAEGNNSRADQQQKQIFQEWIAENREKVRHCTNIKHLRAIERIKTFNSFEDATLKKWFNEKYPNQLKVGRPKKHS